MSPPRVYRVMGQRFQVKLYAHIKYEDKDGVVLGLTKSDEQEVHLATHNIGPDRARETYLHELLHVVFNFAAIDRGLDMAIEEDIIKRVSPILLQALRDNPRVCEYLTGHWVGGKKGAQ